MLLFVYFMMFVLFVFVCAVFVLRRRLRASSYAYLFVCSVCFYLSPVCYLVYCNPSSVCYPLYPYHASYSLVPLHVRLCCSC